jgi:hypothetical protein
VASGSCASSAVMSSSEAGRSVTCPGRTLLVLDTSEVESAAADGVFIGLDWGNSHHQLCILDAAGRMVHQGKYAHDIAGHASSPIG